MPRALGVPPIASVRRTEPGYQAGRSDSTDMKRDARSPRPIARGQSVSHGHERGPSGPETTLVERPALLVQTPPVESVVQTTPSAPPNAVSPNRSPRASVAPLPPDPACPAPRARPRIHGAVHPGLPIAPNITRPPSMAGDTEIANSSGLTAEDSSSRAVEPAAVELRDPVRWPAPPDELSPQSEKRQDQSIGAAVIEPRDAGQVPTLADRLSLRARTELTQLTPGSEVGQASHADLTSDVRVSIDRIEIKTPGPERPSARSPVPRGFDERLLARTYVDRRCY